MEQHPFQALAHLAHLFQSEIDKIFVYFNLYRNLVIYMLKKIINVVFDTCKSVTLGVVDVSTTAVKGLVKVGKDTVTNVSSQFKNTQKDKENK